MFVPISWVCQKQTAVSHSSTEAEVISSDAGLRVESIPAMNLWGTVIDTLSPQAARDSKPMHQTQILKHKNLFGDIDYVPPKERLFIMRTS